MSHRQQCQSDIKDNSWNISVLDMLLQRSDSLSVTCLYWSQFKTKLMLCFSHSLEETPNSKGKRVIEETVHGTCQNAPAFYQFCFYLIFLLVVKRPGTVSFEGSYLCITSPHVIMPHVGSSRELYCNEVTFKGLCGSNCEWWNDALLLQKKKKKPKKNYQTKKQKQHLQFFRPGPETKIKGSIT